VLFTFANDKVNLWKWFDFNSQCCNYRIGL